MTKKEYILQYVTIGVSFLAVIASVFAGWMAYNASISTAQISGRMNKENEIESRLYQQKYDFYKSIIGKLSQGLNYEMISSGSITGYDGFNNSAETLIKILKDIGPEMRILGGDKLVTTHNCIFKKVKNYQSDLFLLYYDESDKREPLVKFQLAVNGLFENIVGGIWLIENAIREDLGQSRFQPIYIYNHSGWNLEATGGWNPIPDCSKQTSEDFQFLDGRFYIK